VRDAGNGDDGVYAGRDFGVDADISAPVCGDGRGPGGDHPGSDYGGRRAGGDGPGRMAGAALAAAGSSGALPAVCVEHDCDASAGGAGLFWASAMVGGGAVCGGVLSVLEHRAAECRDCELGGGGGSVECDRAESVPDSLPGRHVFTADYRADFRPDEFASGVGGNADDADFYDKTQIGLDY